MPVDHLLGFYRAELAKKRATLEELKTRRVVFHRPPDRTLPDKNNGNIARLRAEILELDLQITSLDTPDA